jgi:hypothetical protein
VDTLLGQLGELWGASGLIIGFLVLAVAYLYRAREQAQKEHIETLKATLPLMEKLESTMSTALSVVSKSGGDR